MTVITEFDAGDPEATMHTLADEILKYRRAVKLLAKAIGWAETGAPFALINPGPYGPSVCRSMRRKGLDHSRKQNGPVIFSIGRRRYLL